MKSFHVHVSVSDLEQSICFYSTLFAADPVPTPEPLGSAAPCCTPKGSAAAPAKAFCG